MARETAPRDDNNTPAILGSNAAGDETRRIVVNDDGSINTSDSTEAGLDDVFRSVDLDESEELVASGDCLLRGYFISNRAGSERSIKLYEGVLADVTVGTTAPKMTIVLAAGQSANLSNMKIPFAGGMCAAATTGVADNDTGAPAANEVVVNIFTKAA